MSGTTRRRTPALAGILLLVLSCAAPAPPPAVSPVTLAERFVAALNAGDSTTMLALTEDPLVFREQKWVTTSDGSGYRLGSARDTVIRGTDPRRHFLAALAGRVHVRVPTASTRPPAREALLANELAGADHRWASLRLFVFLRGEGDVEHTAIAGVAEKDGKVAAFYVN